MAVTHGMNLEEVRELGSVLKAGATTLDGAVRTIERLVAGVSWQGPDAARFRDEWWPQHRAKLRAASEELESAGRTALTNAGQQEDASRADVAGLRSRLEAILGRGHWAVPWIDVRPGPGWSHPRQLPWTDITETLGLTHSLAGVLDDTRAVYHATMVGFADLGMRINPAGTPGFEFFRGAKGGHMAAYGPHVDVSGGLLSGGINTANYLANVYEHGWGSDEAVVAAVDGTLSTAASFVPGGGLVYEGSKMFGSWLAENTPLGDAILENSIMADISSDLGTLIDQQDAARSVGDWGQAEQLQVQMDALVDRGYEESSGWKGLWNATVATGGGIVSAINPFD